MYLSYVSFICPTICCFNLFMQIVHFSFHHLQMLAQSVILIFDKVFSPRGIPENLKTDNGTPFQSSELRNFANNLGFNTSVSRHNVQRLMGSLRGL